MSNKSDEIYFPRTIPMAFIRDVKFTWQDNVNGGAISIADLNIKQNSFMGGSVTRLGWMKEYGLYACPNMFSQDIVALYVHDPSLVTELGKDLLRRAFPNNTVVFSEYKEVKFTDEDRRKLNEDRDYALTQGLPPELVTYASSEELKALIKSHASGKAATPGAVLVADLIEPTTDKDPVHEHLNSPPKQTTFLAGKIQPNQSHRK